MSCIISEIEPDSDVSGLDISTTAGSRLNIGAAPSAAVVPSSTGAVSAKVSAGHFSTATAPSAASDFLPGASKPRAELRNHALDFSSGDLEDLDVQLDAADAGDAHMLFGPCRAPVAAPGVPAQPLAVDLAVDARPGDHRLQACRFNNPLDSAGYYISPAASPHATPATPPAASKGLPMISVAVDARGAGANQRRAATTSQLGPAEATPGGQSLAQNGSLQRRIF